MSVLVCAGVCTLWRRGEWKGEERLGVTDVEISLLCWAFSGLLQVTEKVISRSVFFFPILFSAAEMPRKAYFDCGLFDNQEFDA